MPPRFNLAVAVPPDEPDPPVASAEPTADVSARTAQTRSSPPLSCAAAEPQLALLLLLLLLQAMNASMQNTESGGVKLLTNSLKNEYQFNEGGMVKSSTPTSGGQTFTVSFPCPPTSFCCFLWKSCRSASPLTPRCCCVLCPLQLAEKDLNILKTLGRGASSVVSPSLPRVCPPAAEAPASSSCLLPPPSCASSCCCCRSPCCLPIPTH